MIMCESIEDFWHDVDYRDEVKGIITVDGIQTNFSETFIIANQMHNSTASLNLLKATYFAFTSLTTVGFGDMHPL